MAEMWTLEEGLSVSRDHEINGDPGYLFQSNNFFFEDSFHYFFAFTTVFEENIIRGEWKGNHLCFCHQKTFKSNYQKCLCYRYVPPKSDTNCSTIVAFRHPLKSRHFPELFAQTKLNQKDCNNAEKQSWDVQHTPSPRQPGNLSSTVSRFCAKAAVSGIDILIYLSAIQWINIISEMFWDLPLTWLNHWSKTEPEAQNHINRIRFQMINGLYLYSDFFFLLYNVCLIHTLMTASEALAHYLAQGHFMAPGEQRDRNRNFTMTRWPLYLPSHALPIWLSLYYQPSCVQIRMVLYLHHSSEIWGGHMSRIQ